MQNLGGRVDSVQEQEEDQDQVICQKRDERVRSSRRRRARHSQQSQARQEVSQNGRSFGGRRRGDWRWVKGMRTFFISSSELPTYSECNKIYYSTANLNITLLTAIIEFRHNVRDYWVLKLWRAYIFTKLFLSAIVANHFRRHSFKHQCSSHRNSSDKPLPQEADIRWQLLVSEK